MSEFAAEEPKSQKSDFQIPPLPDVMGLLFPGKHHNMPSGEKRLYFSYRKNGVHAIFIYNSKEITKNILQLLPPPAHDAA